MNRSVIGVYLLALVAVLMFAGMGWYLLPLKPTLVALQLTFTREGFASVYHAWSYDARGLYQAHFAADYVFIFFYAAWGLAHSVTSPSMQVLPETTRRVWATALPLAGLADVSENMLHQFITAQPTLLAINWPYLLAGTAASMKWLMGLGFLAVAAYTKYQHHRKSG